MSESSSFTYFIYYASILHGASEIHRSHTLVHNYNTTLINFYLIIFLYLFITPSMLRLHWI